MTTDNNTFMGYSTDSKWDYENGFYLTSHHTRIAKLLSHYELYKQITHLPGEVVECGVFKGASLVRFATFREILESSFSRKIIGFDAFGEFPKQDRSDDAEFIEKFENEAGDGISVGEMEQVLAHKEFKNVDLVKGNVFDTIPEYLEKHPELKISLLHIDVDVYEPSKFILEQLYSRVVRGGLIVFDDYATVAGETDAVDEFFEGIEVEFEKLSISHIPCFVRKPSL